MKNITEAIRETDQKLAKAFSNLRRKSSALVASVRTNAPDLLNRAASVAKELDWIEHLYAQKRNLSLSAHGVDTAAKRKKLADQESELQARAKASAEANARIEASKTDEQRQAESSLIASVLTRGFGPTI